MRRSAVLYGLLAALGAIASTAPVSSAPTRIRESFTGRTHTLSARSATGRASATLQSAGRSSDGFWSYGISSTRDGVSKNVKFSSVIQQAFELHVTDAIERATVVGWASSGGVYAFNVVDLTNGNLLVQVPCYKPEVSPSGRYVAFVQWFAPHFTNLARKTAVYRIVDIASLRREGSPLLTDYFVGSEVYPKAPLGIPLASTSTDSSQIHQIVGDFVWQDDAHVSFVDYYHNRQSSVDVTIGPMGPGAASVSVH
jgi:hypothetical protein